MNAEDQRRLEQLCSELRLHVGEAQAGTAVTLVVRLDRNGHVSGTSGIIPAEVRPLGVESP